MAARIVETSFGTKRLTIEKIQKIKRLKGRRWQWLMWRYWMKVYQYALQECPRQTGALAASIRVKRGNPRGRQWQSGPFGVTRALPNDERWIYHISAGGAGVINPIHKREVDYAKAVHDGWVDPRTGRWHPGNDFLNRAILRAEVDFRNTIKQMMDWVEKEWAAGNLRGIPPRGFYFPVRIIGGP